MRLRKCERCGTLFETGKNPGASYRNGQISLASAAASGSWKCAACAQVSDAVPGNPAYLVSSLDIRAGARQYFAKLIRGGAWWKR